jgi:DNA-binding transcriptional regulator YhcF (GntR family)
VVVKRFADLGFSRRTIYSILKRIDNNISVERKPGSGPKHRKLTQNLKTSIKRTTVGKVAPSYRELGRRFGFHHTTIKKILSKLDIKIKTRKKRPNSDEKQKKKQKTRVARLSRSVMMASKNIGVIMDDESYFTINGNEWQGKNYGYQKGIEVGDEVKYISKEKYPKKVMVWLALSRCGISKPVFFRSGLAVNSEIYVQKCIYA